MGNYGNSMNEGILSSDNTVTGRLKSMLSTAGCIDGRLSAIETAITGEGSLNSITDAKQVVSIEGFIDNLATKLDDIERTVISIGSRLTQL